MLCKFEFFQNISDKVIVFFIRANDFMVDDDNGFVSSEFVKVAGQGGKGNLPLGSALDVVKTEPWDGKDGEIVEEDEFSLEELM